MKRRGIARYAMMIIAAWLTLMSATWLAAPVLAQSITARQPAKLPAPGNFKATPAGDHIALTWDVVSGAASYTVYRGTSSHGETLYISGITSALFNNTSHIAKGAIYYYEVAAVDAQGIEGARSIEAASSTDTAVSVSAPTASHAPAPSPQSNGVILWVLLGILSLAALLGGVSLFLRQHQSQVEPALEYNANMPQQSGVFVAPQATPLTNPRVTAETFPPREWNEMSPSERAGVSGIFAPPPPSEPADYGRQLGAVAFWDDPSEQGNEPPPPQRHGRDRERHQWTYPNPPSWPSQERDR